MMCNYGFHDIHTQMLQCIDDEQLEGAGFVLEYITEVIIEFYRTRDISTSSLFEMQRNTKTLNQFLINKMMMSFVSYGAS